MQLKRELLKGAICDAVTAGLEHIEIDANSIADTTAIKALSEIKAIINDDTKSDFDAIEEIVCIFEKYNISIDCRHDF